MTEGPHCLREQAQQVIGQCHKTLGTDHLRHDHHRYLSVHQERSIHATVVTTTATITMGGTKSGIEITTWELATALGLDIAVGLQRTQRIPESESAMPAERVATIESRMNGTIGTSTQTGMSGATTTAQETTVEKETGTETGGRTGMFQEACKTASLAEGIQSRMALTERACRTGGRLMRLLKEF
jgi:hypothetical protein